MRTLLKLSIVIFCTLTTLLLVGCSSNASFAPIKLRQGNCFGNLKRVTVFTKEEVLTRQWHGLSGGIMELLDWRIEDLKGPLKVAIARYGDTATKRVYCVDVYEFREVTETLGSGAALFLLLHDNRNGCVVNLQIERTGNQVFFNFEREYSDPETAKTIRNEYSYRYDRNAGFVETTGDFFHELPP